MGKKLVSFVGQVLSTFLLVFSLLGLSTDLVEYNSHIENWILIWKSIAHYPWHFLFAWVPVDIPSFIFDYLIIGAILSVALFRYWVHSSDSNQNTIRTYIHEIRGIDFEFCGHFLKVLFLWPFYLPVVLFELNKQSNHSDVNDVWLYMKSIVIAAVVVLLIAYFL